MKTLIMSVLIALAILVINNTYAQEATVSIPNDATIANCINDFTSTKCYDPGVLTISKGTTVTWVNNDNTSHTVTSGISFGLGSKEEFKGKQLGPDGKFDSGIMQPGAKFSHKFDEAGEYLYFCTLHPLMVGKVIVTEAEGVKEVLTIKSDVELPYNRETHNSITLTFVPQANEIVGKMLDYRIEITKDGNVIWRSETLHDHDGTLELMIMPSNDEIKLTGGESSPDMKSTAMYMISGAVFNENGEYSVKAEIVGVDGKTLDTPAATQTLNVSVVPEFPIAAIIPMIIGFSAILLIMRIRNKTSFFN